MPLPMGEVAEHSEDGEGTCTHCKNNIAAPIRSGDVCILFVYFPYFSLYAFMATASISIAREMSSAFMV